MSKQGIASLFKRKNIEVELLKKIVVILDYDFFAHYYEEEPLLKYKQTEHEKWDNEVNLLKIEVSHKDDLLEKNTEILSLQRKYISELEEKLQKQK